MVHETELIIANMGTSLDKATYQRIDFIDHLDSFLYPSAVDCELDFFTGLKSIYISRGLDIGFGGKVLCGFRVAFGD